MFIGRGRRAAVLCAIFSYSFGGACGADAQEASNGTQGDLVAQADQGLRDVYELPPVEVTVDSPVQKPAGARTSAGAARRITRELFVAACRCCPFYHRSYTFPLAVKRKPGFGRRKHYLRG